jgi:propanediol dehydratase large subunit
MSTFAADLRSRRAELLRARPVNRDSFVVERPELGLTASASPFDPAPSLAVEEGRVVELDGRRDAEFDLIDEFIARRGLDLAVAEEAMRTDSGAFARMLVDPAVEREEIVRLALGMTPAKLAEVLRLLEPVELLMALRKMRVRSTPSIQAHVTNRVDHPLLLAADAATAVAFGFREIETTVPVLGHAASNALAVAIGSQVPHPGCLVHCAVEEATELDLGLRGLTSYAETVSVYGTEAVFVDGDDTPWSKAFLASCYASRGLKLRFTSGGGAEALMGGAERRSMLYLEARCVWLSRAAGSQGVQNGGIEGISTLASVPGGMRATLAENLCVTLLDLESCAGNDSLMSHSDIRRTAHTVPLLLSGADFLFSGFGAVPAYDNTFGPSNFNMEDLDDYLAVQRDWEIEGALRHREDGELLDFRRRAVDACRAVYEELGLAEFSDEDAEACVAAHGSDDVPAPAPGAVLRASREIGDRGISIADAIRVLHRAGFEVEASRLAEMLRQRLTGDYLQTSAIFDEDMRLLSKQTDPNRYRGPGTGYRLSPERRAQIAAVRGERTQEELLEDQSEAAGTVVLEEIGPARAGVARDEVVVGLSPAFGVSVWRTLCGLTAAAALHEVLEGIREEGLGARLVRVHSTIDLGAIGSTAARLSGSSIGIGFQAKGTILIHHAELPPLANLELLSNAPLMSAELYRGVGRNAARYARGETPGPLLTPGTDLSFTARCHAFVIALVGRERAACRDWAPTELSATWPAGSG